MYASTTSPFRSKRLLPALASMAIVAQLQSCDSTSTATTPDITGSTLEDQPIEASPVADLSNDYLIAPPENALSVTATPGSLNFYWPRSDPDATRNSAITLTHQNTLTGSTTTLLETDDASTDSYQLAVGQHLVDWQHDRFTLSLCGAPQQDCEQHTSLPLEQLIKPMPAILSAEHSTTGALFGSSIAIGGNGSILVSGAPGYSTDSPLDDNAGAVHLQFEVNGEWWTGASLTADTPVAGEQLGSAVAVSRDGNTLIATAPGSEPSAFGSVYSFSRFGETWLQTVRLESPGDTTGFGSAIALSGSGEWLAVTDSEAVHVYQQLYGDWLLIQTLRLPAFVNTETTATDSFGAALSMSFTGEHLFIAAPGDSQIDVDVLSPGHVFHYQRSDVNYTLNDTLWQSGVTTQRFGEVIASNASGDLLAISANSSLNGIHNKVQNTVALFQRTGSAWEQVQALNPSGTHSRDTLMAIALSDDADILSIGLGETGSAVHTVSTFRLESPMDAWQKVSVIAVDTDGLMTHALPLALSADGNRLFAGNPGADGLLSGEWLPDAGAVYLY